MSIISQVDYTKFRSQKFSTNQPYIQNSIPKDSPGNGGPDIMLRGGTLLPRRITDDVSRITQFFFDWKSPAGMLFTTKQNILSKLEVDTKAPLPQSLVNLNNKIYLPTNTIAQVALAGTGQHISKQGLFPINNLFNKITSAISNILGIPGRLETLYNTKIISSTIGNELYSYTGGPNSLGITGRTTIKLSSDRTGINNIKWMRDPLIFTKSDIKINDKKYRLGLSRIYNTDFLAELIIEDDFTIDGRSINNIHTPVSKIFGSKPTIFGKHKYSNLLQYEDILNKKKEYTTKIIDFRTQTSGSYKSLDYTDNTKTYSGRVNYRTSKNIELDYAASGSIYDEINALPIYNSEGPASNGDKPVNDLIKFRIAVIDNNNLNTSNYIHFRAYIDSFSDSYSSDWDSFRYIGRGEDLYRYKGFTRGINLSWTVVAQSKAELIPMYKKLNYLASSLTPDYSTNGYMRGNIVKLTIGGYLYEQPGIITSITYDIPQESPWEIGIGTNNAEDGTVKELPHMIKVTGFKFIPIHNFVPQKQKLPYEEKNNQYGEGQRYIALTKGLSDNNSNYNNFDTGIK